MYRLVLAGDRVSSACSMRNMFRVVTPRIWVSPRSKSADPCTRGSTSTSAVSGRMSRSPRPSMRTWSRSTRARTAFCVTDRKAALISFSHPAGDDHVEGRPLQLLVGRERDPLTVDVGHPGGPDRAGERQAGEFGGERRGVDRHDVVRVPRVQRENGLDDLDLVAQALDEAG